MSQQQGQLGQDLESWALEYTAKVRALRHSRFLKALLLLLCAPDLIFPNLAITDFCLSFGAEEVVYSRFSENSFLLQPQMIVWEWIKTVKLLARKLIDELKPTLKLHRLGGTEQLAGISLLVHHYDKASHFTICHFIHYCKDIDYSCLKAYRAPTFSFLERALLVLTLTFGVLSCRVLVVEALTGALTAVASASNDIWPLLFPLAGPFLLACCSLEVHDVEPRWSAELLPFESSPISHTFLWAAAGSWTAGFWLLSLRTSCRRWVSWTWSSFCLIGPEPWTDHFWPEARCSGCCVKLEQESKETKDFKSLVTFLINYLVFVTSFSYVWHLVKS